MFIGIAFAATKSWTRLGRSIKTEWTRQATPCLFAAAMRAMSWPLCQDAVA